MAQNVKMTTVGKVAPKLGWAPHDMRQRLGSQLDASTGALTGDQQRYFADLPSEQFSEQPSTSHKIVQTSDGAAEYRQLINHQATWRDPATGTILVNGALRP